MCKSQSRDSVAPEITLVRREMQKFDRNSEAEREAFGSKIEEIIQNAPEKTIVIGKGYGWGSSFFACPSVQSDEQYKDFFNSLIEKSILLPENHAYRKKMVERIGMRIRVKDSRYLDLKKDATTISKMLPPSHFQIGGIFGPQWDILDIGGIETPVFIIDSGMRKHIAIIAAKFGYSVCMIDERKITGSCSHKCHNCISDIYCECECGGLNHGINHNANPSPHAIFGHTFADSFCLFGGREGYSLVFQNIVPSK